MERINDGIMCGVIYNRANCDHMLNFQREKKKNQSLLQFQSDPVSLKQSLPLTGNKTGMDP